MPRRVPRRRLGLGLPAAAGPQRGTQLDAEAGATEISSAAATIAADSGTSGVGAIVRGPARAAACSNGQLVQLSVAGLVVTTAAPPVAVTPVSDGIEKKVFSHAAGAEVVMLASLVSVTVSGLLGWPRGRDGDRGRRACASCRSVAVE